MATSQDGTDGTGLRALQGKRLAKLAAGFDHYLQVAETRGPFIGDPRLMSTHRACLARGSALGTARDAIADADYIVRLRTVLSAWGIGARGTSGLYATGKMTESLAHSADAISSLEGLSIEDPGLDVESTVHALWGVIVELRIAVARGGGPVQAPVVSGSKTLHHLLPALVPPMDRRYTQAFFGWGNEEFQNWQRVRFGEIYAALAGIARQVRPSRWVTGEGWRTCSTKVLDSALVGYCVAEDIRKLR